MYCYLAKKLLNWQYIEWAIMVDTLDERVEIYVYNSVHQYVGAAGM